MVVCYISVSVVLDSFEELVFVFQIGEAYSSFELAYWRLFNFRFAWAYRSLINTQQKTVSCYIIITHIVKMVLYKDYITSCTIAGVVAL